MRKLFFKNLLLLQGLNLLIKPVWLLLIDLQAQNLLGTAYGEYYLVFNLSILLNILLDLGIQSFNNTSVAADPSFLKLNFRSILLTKVLLSVFYLVFILVIGHARNMEPGILHMLAANQVVLSFVLYFRSNINGLHYYAADSLLSVSDKFFSIIICILFFFFSKINIYYFALAQLSGSSLSLIIAFIVNMRYYGKISGSTERRGFSGVKSILLKSLPFALLFALMGMYTRLDVLMMDILLPDAIYHTSIYAQSFRLLDASAMFAMLFSGLLLPMFAKQISNSEDVRPLTEMAATILLLISLTAGLAVQFMSYDILEALYRFNNEEQHYLSASVFRNIISCFIPMCMIYVFSTLLTARGDVKYLNIFAIIALVLNVVLNLILIPAYSSFGASVSSLITQSTFAVLCIIRCYKLFDFQFSYSFVFKIIIFMFCLSGLYYFIKAIDHVILRLFVFCIAAAALSVLSKIIDLSKVLNTFRPKAQ